MVAAMHMSDGIIDVPTSLAAAAAAVLAVLLCGRRARAELDDRAVPMAGLVTAFIFAAQLVNIPILPGVSGHLLGGALAAILVGPYTGALCLTIVLVVQALLFADGGVTALGTNVVNMAVIGVAAGYLTAVLAWRVVGRRARPGIALAGTAFVAALVATVCAAMGFVGEFAIGGASPTSVGAVAGYMVGTHVVIGAVEGAVTAVTVVAIARSRPDLVYLVRRAPQPAATVAA